DEGDVSDLTTVEITKRAGLAQSSFYVHFNSIDHLLRDLVAQVWESRREISRQAREAAVHGSIDEYYRVRFAAHVQGLIEHPAVFRLVLRSRPDLSSPVGEDARAQQSISRQNLVAWLQDIGGASDTEADRRRLRMIAAGLLAVNETIALGHLDGDFPDRDEVLDVLRLFHDTIARAIARGSVSSTAD
ncbi:MAG: TetR family transcriptional regulator, partial [Planctomycetes bacterium]|nr:TetR family transcriptional regulator [Planctomycetota bacterium]